MKRKGLTAMRGLVARKNLRGFKPENAMQGHPGHQHFWERAFSRRKFIQTTTAAAGILLGSTYASAQEEVTGATPKPIPGGFEIDGEVFHVFAPGVFDPIDTDRSPIYDFNGHIGYAIVDGTGIGQSDGGDPTPLFFEADLRFMQGVYVSTDGRHRHATFCFI